MRIPCARWYWKGSVPPLPRDDDPDADTTALEREIDRLVYALYGLTPEEITLVEESAQR